MTRLLRTARMALFGLLAAIAAVPAYAESFYVAGHGGVPLAVTVVGPENSPEILFIHGLGFGGESFSPQLQSDLAARYRMVAFDLRGHAMSGKPWNAEDYVKRGVWAEDVQRVIAAAHLKRPVIVGWSYGTLVAADYVLAKGPNAISGLVLVSALGGLVPPTPPAGTPDPAIIAQLNRSRALRSSPRLADQEEANRLLAPLLFETTPTGPSKEWQAQALSLGLLVAPYAQPHLRNHPVNNSALVAQLAKTPLLVIHGSKDLAVSDADLAKLKKYLPRAAVRSFKSAGHSPFAEQPAAFNAVLSNFVTANWKPVDDR